MGAVAADVLVGVLVAGCVDDVFVLVRQREPLPGGSIAAGSGYRRTPESINYMLGDPGAPPGAGVFRVRRQLQHVTVGVQFGPDTQSRPQTPTR